MVGRGGVVSGGVNVEWWWGRVNVECSGEGEW